MTAEYEKVVLFCVTHADFSAAEGSSAFRLLSEKTENIKVSMRSLMRKHKIPNLQE